jgi:hypothetical protein
VERKRIRRVRFTRDLGYIALGTAILLHQAFVADPIAAELITAAVALLLAPAVQRVDDASRDRKADDKREVDDRGHAE